MTNEQATPASRPPWAILSLLVALLAIPFLLRPEETKPQAGALTLAIVTPHNEAIRYEFGVAFDRWHRERYGDPVTVDWRNVGGTSEIARYLSSQYTAAFRAEWTAKGREWTAEIANSFNNAKVKTEDTTLPEQAREARGAFLASAGGVGLDLFFGGGEYDHSRQAAMGHLVPSGYRDTPEGQATLGAEIPEVIGGEKWFDRDDRWYGVTVSAFGICYNRDVLASVGVRSDPVAWSDLAQPALIGRVALADPTKSGSSAKAFEMVIQQEMATAGGGLSPASPVFREALGRGWEAGLRVIRLSAANARYFTDTASKVPHDVAMAEAAAGMCIDFYGLYQAGMVAGKDGAGRMKYVTPKGGSTVGCDPIAMLRGAPHPELALRFIQFALSPEGQRLWAYRVGAPGGPVRYSLQRLPIRRDFYVPENLRHSTHPELNPFDQASSFTYRVEWTGHLFNALRLLIRTMCIDSGEELRAAWKAVIEHGGPEACPRAMEELNRLPDGARYDRISGSLAALKSKVDEIRLAREWGLFFAERYRRARELAHEEGGGRS
ncbi:MAG: ABC transporter substrate-binding protein [Candidatus Omnitrophica bacterium]|nr:ABC transporter substrate-binding protein [Candidatus Omnitrophota bacterium]